MTQEHARPKVGVAAFVTSPRHPNCVLLGVRKGKTGSGLYAPPAGHLEFGEEIKECAVRETLEETGLTLKNVTIDRSVNSIQREHNFHYIVFICTAQVDDQGKPEPENMEPTECEGWKWIDWDNLPPTCQIFWTFRNLIESGFSPFNTHD